MFFLAGETNRGGPVDAGGSRQTRLGGPDPTDELGGIRDIEPASARSTRGTYGSCTGAEERDRHGSAGALSRRTNFFPIFRNANVDGRRMECFARLDGRNHWDPACRF